MCLGTRLSPAGMADMLMWMLVACVGLAGAQTVDPANYANSITPMGGYTLHWTVGATFVDVGIVTEAVGYAALGIGNRMEGADIWFAGDTVTGEQFECALSCFERLLFCFSSQCLQRSAGYSQPRYSSGRRTAKL